MKMLLLLNCGFVLIGFSPGVGPDDQGVSRAFLSRMKLPWIRAKTLFDESCSGYSQRSIRITVNPTPVATVAVDSG
jgi:hypothetical protein